MRGYSGVTVEVEVDEYDIKEAGYHHEDDCPAKTGTLSDKQELEDALAAMHEQYHPDQPLRIQWCMTEPCRSVYGFRSREQVA